MKRALIVVDMQVDFITGALGFDGAQSVKDHVVRHIEAARTKGRDVIFTMDTHGEDYETTVEGRHLPVKHCIKGTKGHALHPEIAAIKRGGDTVIEKPTFPASGLLEHLQNIGYTDVTLVGLVSHICVISNAIITKAALPNAAIRVDARATGGPDASMHEQSLNIMENLHIDIINRS